MSWLISGGWKLRTVTRWFWQRICGLNPAGQPGSLYYSILEDWDRLPANDLRFQSTHPIASIPPGMPWPELHRIFRLANGIACTRLQVWSPASLQKMRDLALIVRGTPCILEASTTERPYFVWAVSYICARNTWQFGQYTFVRIHTRRSSPMVSGDTSCCRNV